MPPKPVHGRIVSYTTDTVPPYSGRMGRMATVTLEMTVQAAEFMNAQLTSSGGQCVILTVADYEAFIAVKNQLDSPRQAQTVIYLEESMDGLTWVRVKVKPIAHFVREILSDGTFRQIAGPEPKPKSEEKDRFAVIELD
jgi:hypothetical protein